MKKLINTLAILIAFANLAQAQIKLGLKFSPQLTWVGEESKNISTSGTNLNVSYGLMIDNYFTDNYAIATEIGVTTMTAKITPKNSILASSDIGTVMEPTYKYKLQYIAVPLMLKMCTNEIGYFRYYAEFGMNFGFLFRSKADIGKNNLEITNVDINHPEDEYYLSNTAVTKLYNDDVKFLRAALLVGAGIQYKIFGNTQLVAGLRYENAFTDFMKDEDWKATMNMGGLHIGVLF